MAIKVDLKEIQRYRGLTFTAMLGDQELSRSEIGFQFTWNMMEIYIYIYIGLPSTVSYRLYNILFIYYPAICCINLFFKNEVQFLEAYAVSYTK